MSFSQALRLGFILRENFRCCHRVPIPHRNRPFILSPFGKDPPMRRSLVLHMSANRKRKKNAHGPASYLLTLCFLIAILLLSYFYPALTGHDIFGNPVQTEPSDVKNESAYRIHFIDVGQGDSALIQAPTGENMLIDAGPNSSETALRAYLDQHCVTRLDYLVLTHPHEDHIGGADMILETYEVGTVILPDVTTTTSTFERMLRALDKSGASMKTAAPNDTYPFADASFTLLGPAVIHADDLNNCSVVLRLDIGSRHFLFTGDAEKAEEEEILKHFSSSPEQFRADVLKIGHHGSVTSTSDDFLKAVSPSFAVISCGKGNDYGHPHRETTQKLKYYDIPVYRTDRMGSIVFYCDGSSISCAASISSDTVTNS